MDQAILKKVRWVQNLHGCPLSAKMEGESDCVNIIKAQHRLHCGTFTTHPNTHTHSHRARETGLCTLSVIIMHN